MAADQILLEIVTPVAATFTAKVASVTLPGRAGELGVLPGHLPLFTLVKPGQLTAVTDEGDRVFAVGSGFAEILPNEVRVMVSSCDGADSIDLENARDRLKKLSDLSSAEHDKKTPEEIAEHAEHLARERARIQVAEYATRK